jgi:ribosome-associated translation inhibitor RaiA
MNIEATGISRTFGRQTRAYAESRIVASLAAVGGAVEKAAISLSADATGRTVVCTVVLDLQNGGRVRVTARGRHAFDAINQIADRLEACVRSLLQPRRGSVTPASAPATRRC